MQIIHLVGTAAPAVDAYVLTTGRLVGTAGALVALVGLVVGGWALARANRRVGENRRAAVVALVAGSVGLVIGAVVILLAKGGPGTGYGIVGGFAAVAIGLPATVLGWLARSRS